MTQPAQLSALFHLGHLRGKKGTTLCSPSNNVNVCKCCLFFNYWGVHWVFLWSSCEIYDWVIVKGLKLDILISFIDNDLDGILIMDLRFSFSWSCTTDFLLFGQWYGLNPLQVCQSFACLTFRFTIQRISPIFVCVIQEWTRLLGVRKTGNNQNFCDFLNIKMFLFLFFFCLGFFFLTLGAGQ